MSERLKTAREQLAWARSYWALARLVRAHPIEATYYRARAHAALYNARRLLTSNSRSNQYAR